MKRLTFYIGTRDEFGKIPNVPYRLSIVRRRFANLYGGSSDSRLTGSWKDSVTNQVVTEGSIKLEVLTDKPVTKATVRKLATELAKDFRQKTVLATIERLDTVVYA